MKYFKDKEFKCCDRCGQGIKDMDKEILMLLDLVRGEVGMPLCINSSVRCETKNTEVGGSKSSSHMKGYALDIRCNDSVSRIKLLRAVCKVGIKRVGVAKSFIHIDCDPSKSSCCWVY